MPYAIINGRKVKIPFYAPGIAGLIYHDDIDVFPDDDIPPTQAEQETALIQAELRKLWGDKNLKARSRYANPQETPSIREDADFADRLPKKSSSTFLDMEPNPFTTFTMRKIERPSQVNGMNNLQRIFDALTELSGQSKPKTTIL
ncbi:MAG: hypothetical protein JW884_11965 [Deltaproteobacteria bacterium]|nr:hypothetical protein [Deltaproteobacteria bacterium]